MLWLREQMHKTPTLGPAYPAWPVACIDWQASSVQHYRQWLVSSWDTWQQGLTTGVSTLPLPASGQQGECLLHLIIQYIAQLQGAGPCSIKTLMVDCPSIQRPVKPCLGGCYKRHVETVVV